MERIMHLSTLLGIVTKDQTMIKLYDRNGNFITKGKWFSDNILNHADDGVTEIVWRSNECGVTME